MECEFIPLVKDKGGDITLVSNYRATAISNVETKFLESIMLNTKLECIMILTSTSVD